MSERFCGCKRVFSEKMMQLYEVKTLCFKVFRSFGVYNYMKKGDRVDSFAPSSFVWEAKEQKKK